MYSIYSNIRAALRFLMFIAVILLYFVLAIFKYISTSDPIERRKKLTKNGSFVANLIMKAFNIELICKENIPEEEASLILGNHVGFIDIVCLVSLRNGVFITSLEMKNTPVLGQIADLGGCAYVNRQNRLGIQDELKGMVDVLKQGFRVVLYPESVASNGEQVLPFKKTLIMSAGLAGKPIRPFVFNFRKVNGQPVKYEDRDSVCWYGDQTFLPAIWRSLKLDSVTCEIEFLPLIFPKPDEDRTQLSLRLHAIVNDKYVPFTPDMNIQVNTSPTNNNPVSAY
ncbi:1-acyl-sn-glycerol-3-phosphate acyltransferase [bacterium]|nr:1-acyl-sn-glycerol-3-phosphate acyltransferase [bacterium]